MNKDKFLLAAKKTNLSAIAIARKLGIRHEVMSRWVNGWYPVPLKYRQTMARILKLREVELFPDKNGGNHA